MLNNKKNREVSTNNNYDLECSPIEFEEIIENFENVEEEIQEEIIDVIELLQDAVEELENLMILSDKQDNIGDQIDSWKNNCMSEYEINLPTSKCDEIRMKYYDYNEKVENFIEETVVLAEEALKNIRIARVLFDKKFEVYNNIKDGCYIDINNDDCSCGKGYAREDKDEESNK